MNLIEMIEAIDMVYGLGRDQKVLFTIELTRSEWNLLPRNDTYRQRLSLHYWLEWREETISWDGHPFVYISRKESWQKIGMFLLQDGIDHGTWDDWAEEQGWTT